MDDLVNRMLERAKLLRSSYDAHVAVELEEAVRRIEMLEAALRTIDNMIPKDSTNLSAMAMVAGDIAECALNGKWPAFGVIPRIALQENKDA